MTYIFAALTMSVVALWHARGGRTLSPDGNFYLRAYERKPAPYCLRPLCGWMCGTSVNKWTFNTVAAVVVLGVLLSHYLLSHGATDLQALAGVGLLASLSPFVRTPIHFPVLVDAPSYCWMLSSVIAIEQGNLTLACILLFFGALCNEKVAIVVAVIAWKWWALLFCLVSVVLYFTRDKKPTGIDWLDAPFKSAMQKHSAVKSKLLYYVAPFGVTAIGLVTTDVRALLGIALSALALSRSMDYARVVMWFFPLVILQTVTIIPECVLPLAVLTNYFITDLNHSC